MFVVRVSTRIKKDCDADIIVYDAAHIEILKMAAMLSEGILTQFPEKFKDKK